MNSPDHDGAGPPVDEVTVMNASVGTYAPDDDGLTFRSDVFSHCSDPSEKIRQENLGTDPIGSPKKKRKGATFCSPKLKILFHSILDKIEASGAEPSVDHEDVQQFKKDQEKDGNILEDEQLARQIKIWEELKQKKPPAASATLGAPTEPAGGAKEENNVEPDNDEEETDIDKAPLAYACLKKLGSGDFIVEGINDHFPETETSKFGENAFSAVNYLHRRGYSYITDEEEQNRWKKSLNEKRDSIDWPDKTKEALTLAVFEKYDVSASGPKKIVAIYLEPIASKNCKTAKQGMSFLKGSDDESFQGPFESSGEAMAEAMRLGYTRMEKTEEQQWTQLIDDFSKADGIENYEFIPDDHINGLYDKVVAVFEKKFLP